MSRIKTWIKEILHNEGRPLITPLDLWRIVIHLPAGMITVFACQLHWVCGLIFASGFILYEMDEHRHLKDRAYKDISGWLCGIGATILILKILGG